MKVSGGVSHRLWYDSHAAVVRGMEPQIRTWRHCHGRVNKKFTLAERPSTRRLSLDGSPEMFMTALFYCGRFYCRRVRRIKVWADKYRKLLLFVPMRILLRTPRRQESLAGIGLAVQSICSSTLERIFAFREMIVSDTKEERDTALEKILPYQQGRLRHFMRH